eukprot:1639428-Pyramimonas_sp.AAC.1
MLDPARTPSSFLLPPSSFLPPVSSLSFVTPPLLPQSSSILPPPPFLPHVRGWEATASRGTMGRREGRG